MAMTKTAAPANVDVYIKQFPKDVQAALQQLRKTIKAAAPKAEELISYKMPGYKLHGMLVYFAGYKNHIGFYAAPTGHEAFKNELAVYKSGKGSVQFPLDKPLPLKLITQIVKFRAAQNLERIADKKPAKVVVTKAKTAKLSDEDQVKDWIDKLDAASKKEIEAVRKIIKASSSKLAERIKWNAPSYYYKEDILTFGPYKTHKLLLVFHHPAVVKIKSNLLEGNYKDRRLVYFKDKAEAAKNKSEVSRIIKEIIKMIDKK
ncbi:DUF1801 domain-containing protein [Ferruginibacter sp. SUN106]|uniref:DUF1801 domain-containing protein n=1 Tax=Ferruginibacter sp. SUN106 TaxID=2978348 RepID=UPI003D36ECAD